MDEEPPPPELREDGKRIARLPNSGGIECPDCGCYDSEVLRTTRYPSRVMRERQCLNRECNRRWMTTERTVNSGFE